MVDIVVATQSTKISNDSLAGLNAVVIIRPALPFRERKGNFQLDVLKVTRGKGGRAFDTVEIVVETRRLGEEHWASYLGDRDVALEVLFERRLDKANGLFLLEEVLEDGIVGLVENLLGRKASEGRGAIKVGSHDCVGVLVLRQR